MFTRKLIAIGLTVQSPDSKNWACCRMAQIEQNAYNEQKSKASNIVTDLYVFAYSVSTPFKLSRQPVMPPVLASLITIVSLFMQEFAVVSKIASSLRIIWAELLFHAALFLRWTCWRLMVNAFQSLSIDWSLPNAAELNNRILRNLCLAIIRHYCQFLLYQL